MPGAGSAPDAEDGGPVVEVLPDRQVEVDGRRLRQVAEAVAEHGAARRLPQHLQAPRHARLRPHDRPHQRRLAAARRTEQPGHGARRHRELQLLQHRPPAAHDPEPAGTDGRRPGGVVHAAIAPRPGRHRARAAATGGRGTGCGERETRNGRPAPRLRSRGGAAAWGRAASPWRPSRAGRGRPACRAVPRSAAWTWCRPPSAACPWAR